MEIIKKLRVTEPYYIVKMCGDYNDGDYSHSTQTFTESEFKKAKDVIYEMQKIIGESYYGGEFISKVNEFFDKFKCEVDYPNGDTSSGDSIHTLDSISIEYIDNDSKIYDVELV